MGLEAFSQGGSPLHRAEVRVKLVAFALLVLALAPCRRMETALVGLAVGLALVALARLPLACLARRLALVNLFPLLCVLTLPLGLDDRDALFQLGAVRFGRAGLNLALLISLKTNAMVLAMLALVATAPLTALGHGLAALGLPDKLCMLLLFTYRYVHVIHGEYLRLRRTAMLRGFVPATSAHCYRTYGNLVGMTLLKSWNRAARVQQAMLLRGFTGRFHSLIAAAPGRGDWLLFLGAGLAAGLLMFVEWSA